MENILFIVVPCYNEEEVICETAKRLKAKVELLIQQNQIHENSRIIFVNDGSKDKTWEKIVELNHQNEVFIGLKLSRNRGHQNALVAGLMYSKEFADMCITIDADLQDDVEAISKFVEEYHKGCDIVYGVRTSRKKDTFFKRNTAKLFYRFMKRLGVDIVYNHADYRLMSKRAVESMLEYSESNLFLRGIIPLIGYKTATVGYIRNERFAGESKYPLRKMFSFALDGITSFSVKPLRMISFLGITILVFSFGFLLYFLVNKLLGNNVEGFTTLACSLWLLGGLQIFILGIIGEYIGKIYNETKRRPRFFIDEIVK